MLLKIIKFFFKFIWIIKEKKYEEIIIEEIITYLTIKVLIFLNINKIIENYQISSKFSRFIIFL